MVFCYNALQLWDIANGNQAWDFRHPMERHPITCLDVDRDHSLLAGGSMYGMLQARTRRWNGKCMMGP